MAVTVREVLDDALVATAEPQVEVAGDSLDNPVRWVFTNEREDVASFLAGGELEPHPDCWTGVIHVR